MRIDWEVTSDVYIHFSNWNWKRWGWGMAYSLWITAYKYLMHISIVCPNSYMQSAMGQTVWLISSQFEHSALLHINSRHTYIDKEALHADYHGYYYWRTRWKPTNARLFLLHTPWKLATHAAYMITLRIMYIGNFSPCNRACAACPLFLFYNCAAVSHLYGIIF